MHSTSRRDRLNHGRSTETACLTHTLAVSSGILRRRPIRALWYRTKTASALMYTTWAAGTKTWRANSSAVTRNLYLVEKTLFSITCCDFASAYSLRYVCPASHLIGYGRAITHEHIRPSQCACVWTELGWMHRAKGSFDTSKHFRYVFQNVTPLLMACLQELRYSTF